MTHWKEDRSKNEDLALRLMLEALPVDQPYDCTDVHGDREPFLDVYHTTWECLERKGFVRPRGHNRYRLTGSGWIACLEVIGKSDTEEFKKNAGRLSGALRGKLGDSSVAVTVPIQDLVNETGLLESFIYNAIDSHLLFHLFQCRDASWALDDSVMKNHVEVPRDFCHRVE